MLPIVSCWYSLAERLVLAHGDCGERKGLGPRDRAASNLRTRKRTLDHVSQGGPMTHPCTRQVLRLPIKTWNRATSARLCSGLPLAMSMLMIHICIRRGSLRRARRSATSPARRWPQQRLKTKKSRVISKRARASSRKEATLIDGGVDGAEPTSSPRVNAKPKGPMGSWMSKLMRPSGGTRRPDLQIMGGR